MFVAACGLLACSRKLFRRGLSSLDGQAWQGCSDRAVKLLGPPGCDGKGSRGSSRAGPDVCGGRKIMLGHLPNLGREGQAN